jgi:hypothetical protein
MKKCSLSLPIKEMKIRTTLRFDLTPVKLAIIKKTNSSKCTRMPGNKEPSSTVGGNVKILQPLWKSIWRFVKQLMTLQYPSWGLIQRAINHKRDTCTPMFITALFIVDKLESVRLPTTDEWVKKINTYTHTHTHTPCNIT